MTITPNTPAERLIADFYGDNLRAFYPSSVDGTRCVEVLEFNHFRTSTVIDLAKSIMDYKRMMVRIRKANAIKAAA
jgi:hypothetical protein